MTRIKLSRLLIVAPLSLGMVGWSLTAKAAGDPVAGQALYEGKCGGCHSIDMNRIGPLHRGVVGRRPGTAPGYDYSAAVRALGGVWTPARLDQWLQGPQAVAPGAKMFLSVPNPTQRSDIIAYLSSVSPATVAHPTAKRRKV